MYTRCCCSKLNAIDKNRHEFGSTKTSLFPTHLGEQVKRKEEPVERAMEKAQGHRSRLWKVNHTNESIYSDSFS